MKIEKIEKKSGFFHLLCKSDESRMYHIMLTRDQANKLINDLTDLMLERS